MRKRLSCPMFSTSGLLFIMVFTLARGSRTSFERSGELVATVLLTGLSAGLPEAEPGVPGVSDIAWQVCKL